MLKQSLAGTGKTYVEVQARMYPGGVLHVQGRGHKANREYGIAVNLAVPSDVRSFFNREEPSKASKLSQANTGARYIPGQVRSRRGYLHFQFKDGGANRMYGIAFDVQRTASSDASTLWTWTAENIIGS